MEKKSILTKIREQYISNYLEDAKKIHYLQLAEDGGLTSVFYDELNDTEMHGYPVASDLVAADGSVCQNLFQVPKDLQKSCRLRYHYLPHSHEIYLGATGSGKTTGCVEPQLRAISSQKNKPNLFITDPKGELFEHNAMHLKTQGYKTFVLNFKDFSRSDVWNPLLEIYQTNAKRNDIGKNVTMHQGMPDPTLKRQASLEAFGTVGYLCYSGYAFPDGTSVDRFCEYEAEILESKVDDLVNQTVNMMIQAQSKNDRSWEYGAMDLLRGIIHAMLDFSIHDKHHFTCDMMSLKTVQQLYQTLRASVVGERNGKRTCTLFNHPLLKNVSKKAKHLMSTALNNADNTMRSYCGVFDNSTSEWFQSHIFALTTGNTISLDETDGKPFAVFVITRDYEKSDFRVAGLFIDWVYRQVVEKVDRGNGDGRALHFILDEFGNIPKIRDLENKIATARSRNIWFHLVVQSYKQIENIYDPNVAEIIRDNCNSLVFLGAQNYESKQIFSRQCGVRYAPSLRSVLTPGDNSLELFPLIPLSQLDLIKPGEMYIKRLYMPVMTSSYVRSYLCANYGIYHNFYNTDAVNTLAPYRAEVSSRASFSYQPLHDFVID